MAGSVGKVSVWSSVALVAALSVFAPCAAPAVSPAVVTVSKSSSALAAAYDYTNNVLRVEVAEPQEWNDANPKRIQDLFPANAPFHLVVGSDPEDKRLAELAIETVATSMPAYVYTYFRDKKVLAPLTQRILRRCRPDVTNGQDYVSAVAHPTVWRAKDFDLRRIAACAAHLTRDDLPTIVFLQSVYEEYEASPIRRATPLVDYPDPREEVSFETPFGIGIVLRAPEFKRKFRFRATAWPARPDTEFYWTPLQKGRAGLAAYARNEELRPERGFCEVTVSWSSVASRADVAVFAAAPDGPPGPPSIISFYRAPNESRAYDGKGRIAKIRYDQAKVAMPLLYSDKLWTDEYEYDVLGNPIGFTRTKKGGFLQDRFSAEGEFVEETHSNDSPKITRRVRYFPAPEDPSRLLYELGSDTLTRPMKPLARRSRGEF